MSAEPRMCEKAHNSRGGVYEVKTEAYLANHKIHESFPQKDIVSDKAYHQGRREQKLGMLLEQLVKQGVFRARGEEALLLSTSPLVSFK